MLLGSFWNEQSAQQLVRYEAMFKLLGDIQAIEDITDIARRVARQWKYFSNAANWRLTVPKNNAFIIIDGFRGEVVITCEQTLPNWDHYHLTLQRPRLIRLIDAHDGPEPPPHLADPSIVEIMCLPFVRAERCIGLLSAAARHQAFNELDNKFIRLFGATFADRISDLLLRQQATEILIHKATRDPLTGLLNRGAIIDRLESQLALSRRDGQPLSIILLDIDFFKVINDSYGHLPGDEVLREIAHRLRVETRCSDSLGRFGGEEFLLVLYPCRETDAVVSAERFRKCIASAPCTISNNTPLQITVTISLGTATSGQPNDVGMQDLLKQADNALYHAKSTGRNRVAAGSANGHDG